MKQTTTIEPAGRTGARTAAERAMSALRAVKKALATEETAAVLGVVLAAAGWMFIAAGRPIAGAMCMVAAMPVLMAGLLGPGESGK